MIRDEDIDTLPSDTEAAFVAYESILREAVRSVNVDPNYHGWDVEREYVAHILAFIDTKKMALDLPNGPPSDDGSFGNWYKNFVRKLDYFKAAARLRVSERKRENIAVLELTPDFKTQIRAIMLDLTN